MVYFLFNDNVGKFISFTSKADIYAESFVLLDELFQTVLGSIKRIFVFIFTLRQNTFKFKINVLPFFKKNVLRKHI